MRVGEVDVDAHCRSEALVTSHLATLIPRQ